MNSGDTNNLSNITLLFTADEALNDFTINDINTTNSTVSNFTQISSRQFSAKITPTNNGELNIFISEGSLTDDAGNENPLSSTFVWNYDATNPIVLLTSSDITSGSYSTSNSISMTATITNESALTLTKNDFSVENGVLSSFTASSDTVYTFTFTATNSKVESKISLPENTVFDSANNGNVATTEFTWIYDADPLTLSMSSSDIALNGSTNEDIVEINLEFSEGVVGFKSKFIELTNASLVSLLGSGTSYVASIQANENSTAVVEVLSTSIVTSNAVTKTFDDVSYSWTYDTTVQRSVSQAMIKRRV